jgi:hypothetical protein
MQCGDLSSRSGSREGAVTGRMLTFIPSATRGTVVRGFIGVDTLNSYTVAGDELVNIPYGYTVG